MGAVYIVEGVAGAGKDTLVHQLVTALQPEARPVLLWSESAVLASWHHYYVPGIDELRLDLAEHLVHHIATTLREAPESVFVFNRFHVSHAVWRIEKQNNTPALQARHRALVAQLRQLPVRIFHPYLAAGEAAARTSHSERQERAWLNFLERRARDMGQRSPADLYLAQQQLMADILDQDRLPYQRVTIRYGQPVDMQGLLAGTLR